MASGSVFGSTGSCVSLGASSAAITGGVTAATLTTSGDISGEDLSVSGAVSGTTGVFISFNASNAAIANGLTAASLTASGAVTGATGAFASLSVTNAAAITGNATVGGTLTVTGATHGSSATYSGTVTAASFNGAFSGSYSGSTLTTTGAASVNSLAVSNNATIGGTLGVSGYATLAGVTASGITDTGTLSVAGTTSLAGLSATSLSLGGNASMYGNIGVGCAANSNLAFVVCQNTAYDPIAFLAQYGSSDGIVGISAPTGYGAELVFDENTTDYWGIGKAEAQYGRGFYVWDFTNGKNIIYGNYPSGDLYLGESTSAYLTLTASGYAGFGAYPINPGCLRRHRHRRGLCRTTHRADKRCDRSGQCRHRHQRASRDARHSRIYAAQEIQRSTSDMRREHRRRYRPHGSLHPLRLQERHWMGDGFNRIDKLHLVIRLTVYHGD